MRAMLPARPKENRLLTNSCRSRFVRPRRQLGHSARQRSSDAATSCSFSADSSAAGVQPM